MQRVRYVSEYFSWLSAGVFLSRTLRGETAETWCLYARLASPLPNGVRLSRFKGVGPPVLLLW